SRKDRAEREPDDGPAPVADEHAQPFARRGLHGLAPGVWRELLRPGHQATPPAMTADAGTGVPSAARMGPASQKAAIPAANQKYGPPAVPAVNAPAKPITVRPTTEENTAARQIRMSGSAIRGSRRKTNASRVTVNPIQMTSPGRPSSLTMKLNSVSELNPCP